MSSDESDMEINCTPPELRAEAEVALSNLLPPKSKVRYMTAYENFLKWKENKKANSFSETVFLAYFTELGKTKKASTLWSLYSMIKATVQLKQNINIKNYTNLVSWLKRQSDGYSAKKSKNYFTCEHVQNFLNNAPDETYLDVKVILILGINGACRAMELYNLTTEDIEIHGDIVLFKLCDTKTKNDRSFVIRDEFRNIFDKYYALRPDGVKSNKLFLKYANGKCTRQVIGRHKIAAMPTRIASFLNLENPSLYTGHCFRRTAATLLADSGANLLVVKRLGGWKSDKVAEGYIEDSVQNKQDITKNITKNILLQTESTDTPLETKHQSLYTNPKPGPSHELPAVFELPESVSFTKITPKSTLSAPPVFHEVPVLNLQPSAMSPQPPLTSSPPVNVRASEQPASTNITSSQTINGSSSDIQQTNISVPGKTLNISITNCPNMSNVTFNFH